jgi:hypothetical protein
MFPGLKKPALQSEKSAVNQIETSYAHNWCYCYPISNFSNLRSYVN